MASSSILDIAHCDRRFPVQVVAGGLGKGRIIGSSTRADCEPHSLIASTTVWGRGDVRREIDSCGLLLLETLIFSMIRIISYSLPSHSPNRCSDYDSSSFNSLSSITRSLASQIHSRARRLSFHYFYHLGVKLLGRTRPFYLFLWQRGSWVYAMRRSLAPSSSAMLASRLVATQLKSLREYRSGFRSSLWRAFSPDISTLAFRSMLLISFRFSESHPSNPLVGGPQLHP